MADARVLEPAEAIYRGEITDPERWAIYQPRMGDVLVCTPAKCGTTWTQSILVRLLTEDGGLPGPVPEISPWIDSSLTPAEHMQRALDAQTGRRVVKTHTPGDGVPVWEGVPMVAVYRHPLDVFLSIRKHIHNMKGRDGHPMHRPMAEACEYFLDRPIQNDDIDRDSLELLVAHFRRTVLHARNRDLTVLHYADMMADRAAAVDRLAAAIGVEPASKTRARIIEETGFDKMKARASEHAPGGGRGFWRSDADFFAQGGTGKWEGVLDAAQIRRYEARMAELVPEADLRTWLETGGVLPA